MSKYIMYMGLDKDGEEQPPTIIEADNPEDLWKKVSTYAFSSTGTFNNAFVFGVLLNFINSMSDETRANFITCIVDGVGAEYTEEDGTPVLTFKQRFNTLPLEGEVVTPEGLILPHA